MVRIPKIGYVLGALVIAFAGVAVQKAYADGESRGVCKADRDKFCKDAEVGRGHVWRCLVKNEANLSPDCKAKVDEARENAKEFRDACKADAKANCANTQGGRGRIIACLKGAHDKLSDACKAKIDTMHGPKESTPEGTE